MKYKVFALLVIITLTLLMVGCGEKDTNSKESTSPKTTEVTEQTDSTIQQNHYSREDYFNMIYGYYESEDSYINISKDYYQEKNKESGEILKEGKLMDASVSLKDNNVVSFEFVFYQVAYPSVYWNMDSKGNVTTAYGISLNKISQEKYDSVTAKQPETTVATENTCPNPEEFAVPWYMQTFDDQQLKLDLYYIDNLLAVGKESDALVAIEEKIFDKLDKKVSELIKSREYWAAYNYVAMYNKHLGGSYRAECGSYLFLENYFEEKYTSDDAIYGISKRGFSDFTQKYYLEIIQANKVDNDYISKQDCLYILNEYFLSIGKSTRTGLWDGKYMYYTDNLDENFNVTEYYIVCPYTKQIRYLPNNYYFIDGDLYYEAVLDDYV